LSVNLVVSVTGLRHTGRESYAFLSKTLATIVLGLLTACATPYQPTSGGFSRGGYKDAHIKDNLYYVEIVTNAWTDEPTAAQFFHRRAKELCSENGYSDYRIRDERDTSVQQAIASRSGGGTMNKPGFAGYVECIK